MVKVKTFTNELRALHAMQELEELDSQVNRFIKDNGIEKVISVSDTCTSGEGNTIGIIRVMIYEAP
ncbi:MAG: hypothetical protein C0616_01260 [Desulfuromonas sp.]|nr:MAG: hypothetical protein C0616_01260 [Desulfuromonas sp.]